MRSLSKVLYSYICAHWDAQNSSNVTKEIQISVIKTQPGIQSSFLLSLSVLIIKTNRSIVPSLSDLLKIDDLKNA